MLEVTITKNDQTKIKLGRYANQQEINRAVANPENIKRWGGLNNFTVEIVNIADQVAEAEKIEASFQDLLHGMRCIALVRSVNEDKLTRGELSTPQFLALISDPKILEIITLLQTGTFKLAKAKITAISTSYYSDAEKTRLINFIDSIKN